MQKEHNEALLKEAIRLFESGGIYPKDFENDFRLPKIIMSTALTNESEQYQPFTRQDRLVAKKLRHF